LDSEGNETDIPVDMLNHVLPEFMQIARSKGIKKHQCKPTTRKYMYHFEVIRFDGQCVLLSREVS
jgi:hypothetical protein